VDTPAGTVNFLQAVGLTSGELAAVQAWSAEPFAQAVAPHLPFFITDIGRKPLLDNPQIRAAIARGSARDGSSTGTIFAARFEWKVSEPADGRKRLQIVLGAESVQELRDILPGRIPFGRALHLVSRCHRAIFEPGPVCQWDTVGATDLYVDGTPDAVRSLAAAITPLPGVYSIPAFRGLTIEVVPSDV
jgi:hypothetical protein